MIPNDNSGARVILLESRQSIPGSSSTAGGSLSDTARQAWQRAMEQAQMSRWFQPFEAAAATATPTTSAVSSRARSALVLPYRPPAPVVHLIPPATHTEEKPSPDTRPVPTNVLSKEGLEVVQPQTASGNVTSARSSREADSATPSDAGVTLRGALQAVADANHPPVTQGMPRLSSCASKLLPSDGEGQPALHASRSGVVGARLTNAVGQMLSADATIIMRMVTASSPVAERPLSGAMAIAEQPVPFDSTELPTPATPDRLSNPVDASGPSRTVSASGPASARLHAQWGPEGVELWLGLDGTAQQVAQQAALIVQQLCSALQLQGQRLNRVICNGQLVWDSTDSHPQTSSPRFSSLLGAPLSEPLLAPYPSTTFPTSFRETP